MFNILFSIYDLLRLRLRLHCRSIDCRRFVANCYHACAIQGFESRLKKHTTTTQCTNENTFLVNYLIHNNELQQNWSMDFKIHDLKLQT